MMNIVLSRYRSNLSEKPGNRSNISCKLGQKFGKNRDLVLKFKQSIYYNVNYHKVNKYRKVNFVSHDKSEKLPHSITILSFLYFLCIIDHKWNMLRIAVCLVFPWAGARPMDLRMQ